MCKLLFFFKIQTTKIWFKKNSVLVRIYSNLSAVTFVVGIAESLRIDFQTIASLEQGYGAGTVVGEACIIERAEDVLSSRHARHTV